MYNVKLCCITFLIKCEVSVGIFIIDTKPNNMFPDTPQPKCKHLVSGIKSLLISVIIGHLKALECREHETISGHRSLRSFVRLSWRGCPADRLARTESARKIAYQQVYKTLSPSASTTAQGLRKLAPR